jgi:hypothetical protein
VVAEPFGGVGLGIAQDALGLGARISQHLVALLGQPSRRLDLVRYGHPNLVEDV